MIASEIVGEMSDVLKRDGWIQNEFSTSNGRCLYGAYQEAMMSLSIEVGNADVGEEVYFAIQDKIRETCGGIYSMAAYNDREGRAVGEVLTLLDKTRIGLEEKGL